MRASRRGRWLRPTARRRRGGLGGAGPSAKPGKPGRLSQHARRQVTEMVTTATRPGAGVGQGRTAVGPTATAAGAAAALVVLVVAQLEEPHQPDDERADVEHAQPDHEDPARQRHYGAETTSVWSLVGFELRPRRDRARRTARWCTARRPTGPAS